MFFKKCTRWWILGLNSCSAVKGRLRFQQGNVVTIYSHNSLMCEIPGLTVISIHVSTDRALLQPAWHRVRGDVTPTGVCFSILFQAQEIKKKSWTRLWHHLLAVWQTAEKHYTCAEIATFSHPEKKRKPQMDTFILVWQNRRALCITAFHSITQFEDYIMTHMSVLK